jgi:hypothetical protein
MKKKYFIKINVRLGKHKKEERKRGVKKAQKNINCYMQDCRSRLTITQLQMNSF